jgi:hypothetical protein
MTLEMIIEEAKSLSVEDRKSLIRAIVDSLTEEKLPKTHSIMELEGLGAELWAGIDVEQYINEMRDEWDHR